MYKGQKGLFQKIMNLLELKILVQMGLKFFVFFLSNEVFLLVN